MKAHEKTYHAWEAMLQRCNNSKHPSFKHYGGRGIKVCKKWFKFKNFLKDMGEAPTYLTLDRINNDKGYYKNNCRWVSQKIQSWNSRKTTLLAYKGEVKSIRGWGRHLKMPYTTICARLDVGCTIEEAFFLPKHTRVRKTTEKFITYNGETKPMVAWAKFFKINYRTLKSRIRKNWPLELCFSNDKFHPSQFKEILNNLNREKQNE